ncbi:hypothetical protein [Cohnella abietis]|uniref:Uncharacterized protein n=1 Tax=Cohnella abietis TaxID=2507935 RepID=A0A3T1D314_9BACL|nr:hypothetical protein [Cohnella abietis]BBI32490.1 hypothetical protein KCTCHS21_18890 [Cohnella abietis]
MIQVFLSINNNKEVIQLPVPPPEYDVESPWKIDQVDGLNQSLSLIGLRGLRAIEIKSFFPAADYPFLQNRTMWGMDYVAAIERWRSLRLPLRLVITGTDGKQRLNMPVVIDEFKYGTERNGDVNFSLHLTEFAMVNTKRKK